MDDDSGQGSLAGTFRHHLLGSLRVRENVAGNW